MATTGIIREGLAITGIPPSPISMLAGPNTPETASGRRMRLREHTKSLGEGDVKNKVTLERARAKLDVVKASTERSIKRRKLEDFFGESRKVEERSDVSDLAKSSKDSENLDQGVWIDQAKAKLHAARVKKTAASSRKQAAKNRPRRKEILVPSEGTPTNVDGKDDCGSRSCDEEEVVLPQCTMIEKAKTKLRAVKAQTQKGSRTSQRIANSQFKTQQRLDVQLEVERKKGGTLLKAERKGQKKLGLQEIVNSPSRQHTQADADREMSPDVSIGPASSLDFTPPRKRRKLQQLFVDGTPLVGARLISGVKWVPPVSPYGLIQEQLYQDPWKVLVACMLLNKTGGRQMHKVIWDLFELCPNAETCVSTDTESIGAVIRSLGLQNKRAKMLQRFSEDYLGTEWTNVTQLHGIGEYARDAYAIFCEGRWQEVQPDDHVLTKYWRWMCDTQGLGYGFSH